MKKFSYKTALKLWLVPVVAVLSGIFLFNLFIDPLWTFPFSHPLNQRQPGFDERQQKTNRIYFNGLDQYDTLLLGSSRTAYIDQHEFKGMKVFNYGADNMLPNEYEKWIDIATTIKGKPFKNIIIGIDFFGTAKNYDKAIAWFYNGKKPRDYLHNTEEPLYRYKSLLYFDTLKFSYESLRRIWEPTCSDYDRQNVRHCNIRFTDKQKWQHIKNDIDEYNHSMTQTYQYRKDWPLIIRQMKIKYPKTHFILFTTPVYEVFFKHFVLKERHLEDYKRWIKETVTVNGSLYHFMDLNSVTMNLENFFDAHHMYEKGVRWIAHRISGYKSDEIPKDFGKILTRDNLQDYLSNLDFSNSDANISHNDK